MPTACPKSLCAWAAELRRGEISPTQLLQHFLAVIEEREAELQAWVVVDRAGAFEQARTLEQQGCREDQPLWGLPIGIKDIIDVAGLPSRCGARWEADPQPATHDALVVERLRRAGAIILGKTVTTEWACFDPPPTRNPWNLDRTPGGSSSGSAAAVAAGMCAAALGTQTGGSILRPASFCGICGLKPAHRPEFLQGVALVAPTLDHVGPMAPTVADLQVLAKALDGFAGAEVEVEGAVGPFTFATLDDPFLGQVSSEVQRSFQQAWTAIQQDFATASFSLSLPLVEIHGWHRTIMAFEAAQVHRERFANNPEFFGNSVTGLIQEGEKISSDQYQAAIMVQQQLMSEVQSRLPGTTLIALPTTLTSAPTRESTGDPRFNSPWSFLGLPAVTLPCGLSPDSLPLGLQLIGKTGATVLAAALEVEKTVRPT